MNENRREFIEKGLIGLGTVAAGITVGRMMGKVGEKNEFEGHRTPVLTPDGQLVEVDLNEEASPHRALPPEDPAVREGVPGRKWVMVVDLSMCDGCKTCTTECAKMHNTPSEREWIKVFRMKDARRTAPYWFPKPCFHCDNPPCTKVCPVGATFKRQDGIVLIDNERCVGCRFCMAACPYSTRFFNWGRPDNPTDSDIHTYSPETGNPRRVGTVEKCDFCPEMAKEGTLPACVASCKMGALHFGDENEDAVTSTFGTTSLSELLEERAGYRYLEELGTEPRVYYLPPKERQYPGPLIQQEHSHQHTPS